MKGWTLTYHIRKVSKWNRDTLRRDYSSVPTIECRKKFGPANVLIAARYTETLVSMNGTAELTSFDLQEMAEVMSYAQDCIHKGVKNP